MTSDSRQVGLTQLLREAFGRLVPGVAAIMLRRLGPDAENDRIARGGDGSDEWDTARRAVSLDGQDVLGDLPLPQNPGERDRALDRLLALVQRSEERAAAWSPASCPDPLSVAAQFLAVPRQPYTLEITRSVLTRAVADAYGICYEGLTVRALRDAHDVLEARFRQSAVTEIRHGQRDRATTHFLIDCLCLGGWCERVATAEIYEGFLKTLVKRPDSLGLRADSVGRFRSEYSESDGRFRLRRIQPLPSINEVVRFAFAQPTGVPGFDLITGGLLGPMRPPDDEGEPSGAIARGVVTLIAGPAGTGKTTLALALASRLAELGVPSEFFGVEEPASDLVNRVIAGGGRLWTSFASTLGNMIPSGVKAPQFQRLKSTVRLDQLHEPADGLQFTGRPEFPFSRCLVIDSVTALLDGSSDDPVESAKVAPQGDVGVSGDRPNADHHSRRDGLMKALAILRRDGTLVFLVGTPDDAKATDLAYLVDNVISLNVEFPDSGEARRTLTLQKTRQQLSTVGQHLVELHGFGDLDVVPSLPTWLEWAAAREATAPDRNQFIFVERALKQEQLEGVGEMLQSDDASFRPIRLRAHAQTMIFGFGSSSKARIALSFALRRLTAVPASGLHGGRGSAPRTLVISFLYDARYYEATAQQFYLHNKTSGAPDSREAIDVYVIPPGAVSAPAVVAEIERRLDTAELEGRPFSCAVIDGVHNLLVQFPRIDHERLFLPTVLRTLHTRPLSVFVTFTRFSMPRFAAFRNEEVSQGVIHEDSEATNDSIRVSQELLYHLLVSRVDYSLLAHRLSTDEEQKLFGSRSKHKGLVKIALTQSIDQGPLPALMYWDPETMSPFERPEVQ